MKEGDFDSGWVRPWKRADGRYCAKLICEGSGKYFGCGGSVLNDSFEQTLHTVSNGVYMLKMKYKVLGAESRSYMDRLYTCADVFVGGKRIKNLKFEGLW